MKSWLQERQWSNRRILLLLALGTLVVSIVWRLPEELSFLRSHMAEMVVALVLAMGLTYTLRPGVEALCRTKFFPGHTGRMMATTVMFIATGLLIYGFSAIGLKPIAKDGQVLWQSFVAQTPEERVNLVEEWSASVEEALKPYRHLLPSEVEKDLATAVPNALITLRKSLAKWLASSFAHVGFLIELLLVPVLVFYFLADGRAIRAEAKLLLPANWRPPVRRMVDALDDVLDGYIRGQILMCIIAWFLVTVGLLMLGVPHAFTLGLIAGLTRAVPIIGPILGGIPILLVCLLTTKSVNTTMLVLVGFTAMHFLESKVLLPKVIGREVDLHPVSVILALLIGMEFFGFVGVFLAVPIAAVGKIVLAEWHASRSNAALESAT